MDQLKEGISLRSFAQRDPLIEYKREGFEMFQAMYDSIHQEVAEMVFKIQHAGPARLRGVFSSLPQKLIHQEFSGLSDSGPLLPSEPARQPQRRPPPPSGGQADSSAAAPLRNTAPKAGRNDPCPCGSGKKYKKCCGK